MSRAGRRGQTLVELALVLPLLTVLILGTLEIGLLIRSHARLSAALGGVLRLAPTNDHQVEDLRVQFAAVLDRPGSQSSFAVTTSAADPLLGDRPAARIHVSYFHTFAITGGTFQGVGLNLEQSRVVALDTGPWRRGALVPVATEAESP